MAKQIGHWATWRQAEGGEVEEAGDGDDVAESAFAEDNICITTITNLGAVGFIEIPFHCSFFETFNIV